jgi:CheY-like chemotaxis protein
MNAIANDRTAVYRSTCRSCGAEYDALDAQWCDCDRQSRTLRCAACQECFCSAPISYQYAFWSKAPQRLRTDSRRFRLDNVGVLRQQPLAAAVQKPPTVLVVDDDEEMRTLVSCFVEQLGYTVVTSGDPREGLMLAQKSDVKVVISDALMPGMDGREMCRRIKETAQGATKKVIVMTSLYTGARYSNEAFALFRVDGYLKKPLDLNALAELVQQFAPLAAVVGAK